MPSSTRSTLTTLAASAALGAPIAAFSSLVLVNVTGRGELVALAIAATVLLLVAANRLARQAAQLLGAARLPWALWAAVTLSMWIAIAAVIEIGMLFSANDSAAPVGALEPVMIGTGALGLLSVATTLAVSATIASRLGRRGAVQP